MSRLKKGDLVMVIAGGNEKKRPNKGKIGKILRFVGEERNRVVVEGLNFVSKHKRARTANETSGKVAVEAPIHVSNVMYYAEKIKRPVKLRTSTLTDGKKVRGYTDPKTKEFVQIA